MGFLATWVLYPLILLGLCASAGLLSNALTGRRLPGSLVVPAGVVPVAIAALIAARVNGADGVVVAVLSVLAVAGVAFSVPWRYGPFDPGAIVVGLAGFAVVAVPAIVSGEPSEGFELSAAWAFPPSVAFLTAMLLLCVTVLAEGVAAKAGRAQALRASLLALLVAAALVPGAWATIGGGLSAYDRLAELHEVGTEIEGEGPVLIVDEDLFGAVRALDAGLEAKVTGVDDLDVADIALEQLFAYRTLILRSSSAHSRPPQPYERVRSGDDYDVWQRPTEPDGPVLHHMALGGPDRVAALPDCPEVVGLGLLALSNQLGLPAQSIAIIGASPAGSIVAVPPGEARRLCGRRWDWIEAVGVEALGG